MNKTIMVKLAGPCQGDWFERPAIPLGTPHFVATFEWAHSARPYAAEDIAAAPAITHLATGRKVSHGLNSIGQARKIAAVLEGLPIPWDGSVEEIQASRRNLPPPLLRWLRVEVCGGPDSQAPDTRHPAPETYSSPEAR